MAGVARLPPHLARYFGTPLVASAGDVRKAYLRCAKRVHPDVSKASCEEFQRLQLYYREANVLLQAASTEETIVPPSPQGQWCDMGHGAAPKWSTFHGSGAGVYGSRAHSGNTFEDAPPGVVVEGLPQVHVYRLACASIIAGVAFVTLLAKARSLPQPSPLGAARTRGSSRSEDLDLCKIFSSSQPLALSSGPWSVPVAAATWKRKPSGPSVNYDPRSAARSDVDSDAVCAAAEDGRVWWLERCGAQLGCRDMLGLRGASDDTPLHHAARSGSLPASCALLRLGADPRVRNAHGLLPEELAASGGYGEVERLLCAPSTAALRHPDGFGQLTEPPADVIFIGLRASESIRHAVNMAAGYNAAPPLPVSRAVREGADAADRVANIIRGGLQSTEFDLEDVSIDAGAVVAGQGGCGAEPWAAVGQDVTDVCGLLIYEPPGHISPDAPGHWVALRRAADDGSEARFREFWRLDPVRGSFRLCAQEAHDLLRRYRAWRVVRMPPHQRLERAARLADVGVEARTLMRTTEGRLAEAAQVKMSLDSGAARP